MKELLNTKVGRLRIIGFLEGISLLVLVFVAVPMKYFFGNPVGSEMIGPVHGVLFLLFVFFAFSLSVQQRWSFKSTTWKVLLACVVPFGTFYIDHKILRNIK